MKAASVSEIKKELKFKSPEELMALCLRLARFKIENKELLTYLLYEKADEEAYVAAVKNEMDLQFEAISQQNYYWMSKSIRKILRMVKKFIRYSLHKTTEIELLLYFCQKILALRPSIKNSNSLNNLYERLKISIAKSIHKLQDDLQYDYTQLFKQLEA